MASEDDKFAEWVKKGGLRVTTVKGDNSWNRRVVDNAADVAAKTGKTNPNTK